MLDRGRAGLPGLHARLGQYPDPKFYRCVDRPSQIFVILPARDQLVRGQMRLDVVVISRLRRCVEQVFVRRRSNVRSGRHAHQGAIPKLGFGHRRQVRRAHSSPQHSTGDMHAMGWIDTAGASAWCLRTQAKAWPISSARKKPRGTRARSAGAAAPPDQQRRQRQHHQPAGTRLRHRQKCVNEG